MALFIVSLDTKVCVEASDAGKAVKTPAEPASAPAASEVAMREPGEEG